MENRSGRDIRILAPLLILLLLRASAVVRFSAEKAYREARAEADRGDFVAASAMADAAIARSGDVQTEWSWALRILQLEAMTRMGEKEAALRELERPLPAKYRTSEAAVRRLMVLGQYRDKREQSAVLFEEARALAAAHQPQLLFGAHLALANAAADPAKAEEHFRIAQQLAHRGGNRLQIGLVTALVALRHTTAQRYADAVESGHEALKMLAEMGADGRAATVAGNLGWAYAELGETEIAQDLFLQAEAAAARAGTEPGRTIWINQLGNVAFERRDFAAAERYYASALQRARRNSDGNNMAAILTNLARTNLELGRYGEAKRLAAEALAVERSDDQRLRTRIVDARVAMMSGEHGRAEAALRDVASKAENPATRWWARGYLAQLYVRTKRNALAEKAFRDAIETVRAARESIDKPELRLAFYNISADIFRSYVDFLVQNLRFEDALGATELIRAQSLEERLKLPPLTQKLDARLVARQQRATILSY